MNVIKSKKVKGARKSKKEIFSKKTFLATKYK